MSRYPTCIYMFLILSHPSPPPVRTSYLSLLPRSYLLPVLLHLQAVRHACLSCSRCGDLTLSRPSSPPGRTSCLSPLHLVPRSDLVPDLIHPSPYVVPIPV